ncbi:hypothetical protein ACG33_01015 [Steroidobacter denitrificans]|uniref:Lipoprotein n=1 Tax=Steroidobacter denitrificans TaxID=465721 RepID=A0A127F833_STEDE|nr:hypothetical protein [Steroidobacter denitrificans]AMN45709.1 hypothetical protein ACG33_01015 [Steroidobacter denitrificans]
MKRHPRFVATTRPARAVIGVLLACSLLAACSGEPSEKDIRRAVENSMNNAGDNPFAQIAAEFAGADNGRLVEVHELEKLGCRKDTRGNGFDCDISMDVSVFGMRQRSDTRVRMVRGKEGWVAMQH